MVQGIRQLIHIRLVGNRSNIKKSMKKPQSSLITVLIPVYNSESFLREAIDSVLCQTFSNFELLLLDDGSTDSSSDIIKSYTDQRIKYVSCSHNFTGTLNRGLNMALGKYIALLDHDDIMMPQRLQIQYDFLESNPGIAACGAYMHTFGQYAIEKRAPLEHSELLKEMIVRSPMFNPTGFIRKDILRLHHIQYQEGYSFAADFKFWSDLIKVGKVVNIPKVLTLYRTSLSQTSIVYGADSSFGAFKIQQEMIDYLLSFVDEEDELFSILDQKLLPALNELDQHSFLSANTFFPFMYGIIDGLHKKGSIIL